jgi:hypothetical protein
VWGSEYNTNAATLQGDSAKFDAFLKRNPFLRVCVLAIATLFMLEICLSKISDYAPAPPRS